jgi:hypothetical protein
MTPPPLTADEIGSVITTILLLWGLLIGALGAFDEKPLIAPAPAIHCVDGRDPNYPTVPCP